MTVLTGVLALLTGLAYTGLGLLAAVELFRHRRRRGFSHFGFALLGMGFTCGPHHLLHAGRQLLAGEGTHGPLTAALALGVLPGVAFVGLRIEAAFGGRGDRLVSGSPLWVAALPLFLAAALGAAMWEGLRHAAVMGTDLRALIPNVLLFASYTLVGLIAARAQVARRPVLGGWSVSGVAMAGVFLTCAPAHLMAGLLTVADSRTLLFDDIGVPAAFYFLWAVYRLHRDSARDWNRRPLVGRPAPSGRRSPWAAGEPST